MFFTFMKKCFIGQARFRICQHIVAKELDLKQDENGCYAIGLGVIGSGVSFQDAIADFRSKYLRGMYPTQNHPAYKYAKG